MAEKVNNLLTFENVVKLCGGVIAICGLYYALDKRLTLIEAKMDYVVENIKDKEIEAKIELAELKEYDKEQAKELATLKERLVRIYAVLPKRVELEIEKD